MRRIREKGKNNLFIFSLALLFNVLVLTSFSNQIPDSGVDELKTIVLDAGHGGKDPGCNGADEIWEKEVTLKVVKKLGKLIEDSLKDVRVLYTRKTDVFIFFLNVSTCSKLYRGLPPTDSKDCKLLA